MATVFSNSDKLASIERELAYRRRVYAGLVGKGRMTQAMADYEVAVFEAIAADYRPLAEKERLL